MTGEAEQKAAHLLNEIADMRWHNAVNLVAGALEAERDALAQQLERATIEREQLAKTYDKTVERLEREIAQLKAERDAAFVRGLERALTVLHTQMARGWDGSMIMMYQAIQAEIDEAGKP